MYSLMCYFSKLGHIAYYKAKNKTVKTNLHTHTQPTKKSLVTAWFGHGIKIPHN